MPSVVRVLKRWKGEEAQSVSDRCHGERSDQPVLTSKGEQGHEPRNTGSLQKLQKTKSKPT